MQHGVLVPGSWLLVLDPGRTPPTQCWPINGCSNALRTTIAFYALAVSSDFVPSERSVGMGGVLAFKCNKELKN